MDQWTVIEIYNKAIADLVMEKARGATAREIEDLSNRRDTAVRVILDQIVKREMADLQGAQR